MKPRHHAMTAHQLATHRREWADYVRLRRRPEKECLECHRSFPNDRDHFVVSHKGMVTAHCRQCNPNGQVVKKRKPPPPLGLCPICEAEARLVVDKQAPASVLVCRRCVMVLNLVAAPGVLDRLADYMQWRESRPAG